MFEILGWASKGKLRLEAGIPYAQTETGPIAGAVELNAADLMRLARIDGAAPKRMRVYRVKVLDDDERPDWIFVSDETGQAGIEISIEDILIPAEEYRRFEDENDLGPPRRVTTAGQTKHNWEGMFAALCKRIFETGLPETKENLVREMECYFIDSGAGEVPDISTIRKKVGPIWAELREAG
ncbi:hypothetical protein [Leisingera daeponensis]|uniref:hypothetical protein n=1 Tax=Leisingera daeponensis TaxID=405746 RepID=UPI001C975DD0|nr:hypothetical protein [Leisingera daeponensis]MBY6055408.1 hypothetical protein [Leisingera daeponensis]